MLPIFSLILWDSRFVSQIPCTNRNWFIDWLIDWRVGHVLHSSAHNDTHASLSHTSRPQQLCYCSHFHIHRTSQKQWRSLEDHEFIALIHYLKKVFWLMKSAFGIPCLPFLFLSEVLFSSLSIWLLPLFHWEHHGFSQERTLNSLQANAGSL